MTTHIRRRSRYTAAFFALTLPLAVAACGTDDEKLAEPDLTSAPETSSAAEESEKEETSERSSTTVSTIYETEGDDAEADTDDKGGEDDKGDKEAGAGAGSEKGPCDWTPMEEGEPGELISFYCDGSHAGIGTYATDHTEYVYWDGKEWAGLEASGQTYTGFKCYDEAEVDELGFPDELKEKMIICD